MAKPEQVTTWESYREICPDDLEQPEGLYQAYETRYDESGVWSPKTDQNWETKTFAEARRMAKALAAEYAALNP